MGDVAIQVRNLGKRYRIGALMKRNDTLRDQIVDWSTNLVHRFQRNPLSNHDESSCGRSRIFLLRLKRGRFSE